MKQIVKRILVIALVIITASAFTVGVGSNHVTATTKCSTPKITYCKAINCNSIALKYKGGGKYASTYLVYMKTGSGKYKLVKKTAYKKSTDGKKLVTIKGLNANNNYSFKVRAAKSYKQKQYWNSTKKKWQNKKPSKKDWKGKKTRIKIKYKWRSSYSGAVSEKTTDHQYSITETEATFEDDALRVHTCDYCGDTTVESLAPAGCKIDLNATAELVNSGGTGIAVKASWDEVIGATGYEVERAVGDGDFEQIYYSKNAQYYDSDITGATSYRYRITAYKNTADGSIFSEKESITSITTTGAATENGTATENVPAESASLAGLTGVEVVAGHNSINVSWKKVSGARTYVVYCDGEACEATDELSYKIDDLTPAQEYTLSVTAARGNLESTADIGVVKTSKVPAPKNLKYTATLTSITLSWDAVDGADKYRVNNTSVGTSTTKTFEGLEPDTSYEYQVTAQSKGKVSAAAEITAKTKPIPKPSNLRYTSTDHSITLLWDAVEGATNYRITCLDNMKNYNAGTDTSKTFEELLPNTSHTYMVKVQIGEHYGEPVEITAKTKKSTSEWPVAPEVYLDYGQTRIYLGQNWSSTICNQLKSASNGFEQVSRPGYGKPSGVNCGYYDVTTYMFDINDYDHFLAINVAGGKVIRWMTNGPVFGNVNGQAVNWGDCVKNYTYGTHVGYRTDGACNNVFTDIDKGDTVVGGFGAGCTANIGSLITENEKRVGFHYINAYRVAGGKCILTYSNALDGKNNTWSGESNGKTYTNIRYGTQPFVETVAASKLVKHETDLMTSGPLAGLGLNERLDITYAATGVIPYAENVATGGLGESCLGSYMSSTGHLVQLLNKDYTKIGLGLCGNYNAQEYSR